MLTIGVLGGMGPAATADFLVRLVESHPASRDQEHPPCIVYSASATPDRASHMLGRGGEDPTPDLIAAARVLEEAGADLIAVPCNSAHGYLGAIQDAVEIPVIDMIAVVAAVVRRELPEAAAAGLLAADGTVYAGLYDGPLSDHGLRSVYPSEAIQEQVMASIRALKAGRRGVDLRLQEAIDELLSNGADVLVAACTEIPLALDGESLPVPLINSTQVLVDACLASAVGRVEASALTGSPVGVTAERLLGSGEQRRAPGRG